MKALFVDNNVLQISLTANYLPCLIARASDECIYYGPGYVSDEIIEHGLQKWIEQTGPYDFIVFGSNTPILVDDDSVYDGSLEYLLKYTANSLNARIIKKYFLDIKENYSRFEAGCKIVSVLNFDYYAATSAQLEKVVKGRMILLGPNAQFVNKMSELPEFAKEEKHYKRKKYRLSDAWYDYTNNNPDRIIPALHFVVDTEFFHKPIDQRRYDVAVPGIEYFLRKKAILELKNRQYSMPGKSYFHLYRIANRLGLPVYSNSISMTFYNYLFVRTLTNTKFVYTAKGGFGIPIRKYFEVPAAGPVMISSPCNGFSNIGFVDGVNCRVAEPDQLPDVLNELQKSDSAQDIANAGQKLIFDKHSLSARASQLRLAVDRILNREYRGASWTNGEFGLVE